MYKQQYTGLTGCLQHAAIKLLACLRYAHAHQDWHNTIEISPAAAAGQSCVHIAFLSASYLELVDIICVWSNFECRMRSIPFACDEVFEGFAVLEKLWDGGRDPRRALLALQHT